MSVARSLLSLRKSLKELRIKARQAEYLRKSIQRLSKLKTLTILLGEVRYDVLRSKGMHSGGLKNRKDDVTCVTTEYMSRVES